MLESLHVKNLALIDEAEVDFGSGLNILTGETANPLLSVLSTLRWEPRPTGNTSVPAQSMRWWSLYFH